MKLTDYELKKMQSDINMVIDNSRMFVDIHNILPLAQQTSVYNELLREYDGEILYDIQANVPVELIGTDDSIKYLDKLSRTSAGDRHEGMIFLNIPMETIIGLDTSPTVINLKQDSFIIWNGDRYKVVSIHPKEFENAVVIYKMIGSD